MKKQYFVYVNFDRRRMGIKENKLDWEVGEETIIKESQEKVLVYAILNLNEIQRDAVKLVFNKLCESIRRPMFHEKVNEVVERLIEMTSDEATCDWVIRKAEEEEMKRIERERRREEWLFDHVFEPFMRSLDKKIGLKI